MKNRSWLLFSFFLLLLIILVIFYFKEIKKELFLLTDVQPFWLLAALSGQLLTYLLTGMEYQYLLKMCKATGIPGLNELSKAAVISLCFNQTVPSAGISGNLFYFRFLERYKISREKIFSLIIQELLIYYACMESFIIVLLCLYPIFANSSLPIKTTLICGLAVYPALAFFIVILKKKHLYQKVLRIKWVRKLFKQKQTTPQLQVNTEIWKTIKKNKMMIAKAYLVKLLVTLADVITLLTIFWGIGSSISPIIILAAYIGTNIISLLPFSPGALVLYESSMTYLFVSLGIPISQAVITTLVFRLLSFWLPIPAGIFLYKKWLSFSTSHDPDHGTLAETN
jgi:uncharacterized protein (TIRG00374 family)